MRVVSWNLAAGTTSRSAGIHDRAWRYLEELDPDVALLQEVVPPDWARERADWRLVHRPFVRWVTAILARAPLRLVELEGPADGELDAMGHLAAAELGLPGGASMLVGSVHTPIGEASRSQLGGRDPELVRTARYQVPFKRDAAYAVFRDRTSDRRFIVGGDWSTSRLWDELHDGTSEVDFFERAQGDGWVECYRRFHPSEGQTWFRSDEPPYQLDHVFCDPATGALMLSCEIDQRPAKELRLSDHAPLVIEFAAPT
ncbi:MAG: hypothetical protein PVH07_07630 [Chloroflexota bacterium]|jgi:exonuclease III